MAYTAHIAPEPTLLSRPDVTLRGLDRYEYPIPTLIRADVRFRVTWGADRSCEVAIHAVARDEVSIIATGHAELTRIIDGLRQHGAP